MPKIPVYLPFTVEPEIRIYYEDRVSRGSNGFKTVKEFAEFLNDNPEIAKALGYVPKKK